MRLGNALALWRSGVAVADTPRPQLSSPWSVGSLTPVVWADIMGLDVLPPSRGEAMQVTALARAVNLTKSTIARCPLVVLAVDQPVVPLPSWCQRTDSLSSPFHRMLRTVDDLIFWGESLWLRLNGADGFPLQADHLDYSHWEVDAQGQILIGGEPIDADRVIYFPGCHEGVLRFGAKAIRAAGYLEDAALENSGHPFRIHLHQLTDAELSNDEKADVVNEARQAMYEHGGILLTNAAISAEMMPFDSSALLIEARNAAAVDMARLVATPAALVDATSAGASLTYETTAGRNAELIDYGLSGYMAAVAARLSMDDVVPRGQRAAFDTTQLSTLTPSPTGAPTED